MKQETTVETTKSRFDRFEKYFSDMEIRLTTASKCNKTILSTETAASLCDALAQLCRELKKT